MVMTPDTERTSEALEASEALFNDLDDEWASEEPLRKLVVDEGGARLDKWLTGQLPEHSRSEIERWIEGGLVGSGGRALKASYRVAAGEEITICVPPQQDYAVVPEPIPLDVLFEDSDLLVINKPAGMVVHPGAGNWRGTLVNAVLYRWPDLEGVGGGHRPGIVHRLDKDTSGLILVAKNDRAHRLLQAQFKAREVQKSYVALVYGQVSPEAGTIEAFIGRDVRQRKRMAVVPAVQGRPAVTRYETVGHYRPRSEMRHRAEQILTLLACHPLTGRTHQIRVHLAHVGHPILGDNVYGGRRRPAVACPRQFLHAERLRFRLPGTGEMVEFTAPLPADLASVLAQLVPWGDAAPEDG